MRLPKFMLQHSLTVEPLLGEGAGGQSFGEPVELPCLFEPKAEAAVAADGSTYQATGKVLCQLDTLEHFPLGSRITDPYGRECWVRGLEPFDPGSLPLPASLVVTVG